jgi:hypothetical protein
VISIASAFVLLSVTVITAGLHGGSHVICRSKKKIQAEYTKVRFSIAHGQKLKVQLQSHFVKKCTTREVQASRKKICNADGWIVFAECPSRQLLR